MTRTHRIAALAVGVLLPLGSCVFGTGRLSYGMYAHAPEYRLDVFAVDSAGARHRVPPSALAQGARASVVPLLAGADHWRTQPGLDDLRSALPMVAEHGCASERTSQSVEVVLEERAREGSPVRTTHARATCRP
jgi:hypothetical protein